MASTQAGGSGTGYDDQEMLRMLRGQGGGDNLMAGGDPGGPTGQAPAPVGGTGGGSPRPDAGTGAPTPRTGGTAYGDPSAPAPIPKGLPATPAPTLPTAYQPGPMINEPGVPGTGSSNVAHGMQAYQEVPDVPGGVPSPPDAPLPPTAPPTVGENPLPGTPGGGAPPAGGQDWSQGPWDAGRVAAYFQSRGVTPAGTSPDYWAQKWQEWGSKDPQYFLQRLSQANEFGGGGGSSGGGGGGASIPNTPYEQDPMVKDAIRRLLERGQTMPSGDDPAIRAQFNPQDQAIQHGAARAKASAAERAFGQGQVGAGANDLASAQIDQASSQNEAGLMGSLIGNELQARRQDVVQALTMAQGEERNALQQYLANLDAILRNQGLTNQNQQYYDDLGFRIGQSTK